MNTSTQSLARASAGKQPSPDATAVALQRLSTQLADLGPSADADASSEADASFPPGSFLGTLGALVEANTDLPPEFAQRLSIVDIGHGLTKLGVHAELAPHHTVYPNLGQTLILPAGIDLRMLSASTLMPILQSCPRATLPLALTTKSLLKFVTSPEAISEAVTAVRHTSPASGQIACGLLLSSELDLLVGRSRSTAGATLTSCLARGLDGYGLEGQIGKSYIQSLPVRLSLCFAPSAQHFFARVDHAALLEGLPSRLPIVRIRPRASQPRLSYGIDGVSAVAQSFATAWSRIEKGPRAYKLAPEARALLDRWWSARCTAHGALAQLLRRCIEWALAYALIFAALEEAHGAIDARAMRIGLALVDRHLRDLAVVFRHVGMSDLHRSALSVEAHMLSNPAPTRASLLRHSGFNAKQLNAALEVLAELYAGTEFGEKVMDLLSQTRTSRR